MPGSFVHLHNHTEYSLLDGAVHIKDLIAECSRMGMPAVAVTDHGNLFGAIELVMETNSLNKSVAAWNKEHPEGPQKQEVKPIFGCEVYLSPTPISVKKQLPGRRKYTHLLLLAENETGWQNLVKLVSRSHLEGFYYKPRVDMETLREFHEGLICCTACIAGPLNEWLLNDQPEKAEEALLALKDIFGDDNIFVELQDHGMEEQKKCLPELVRIARKTNTPIVATNDVHFLRKEDHDMHDVLICIGTNEKLASPKRMRYSTEVYLKSPEEMREVFKDYPEAVENTLKIAERCNVTIKLDSTSTEKYPEFGTPDGSSREEYLRKVCYKGLEERYGKERVAADKELRDRLDYELGIINQLKFPSYFLITADFINWAKDHDIPVGPGRGSAAGSLVAYAMKITNIDPLRFGLIFERFLNPERVSPPDIDIDFCQTRRPEVIDYVRQKYGERAVSHIITYGTMGAKSVLRDVARVMDMSYADGDRISKLIETGPKVTLQSSYKSNEELRELIASDEGYAELWGYATRLEGLIRNVGVHAAGVVIGDRPLDEHVALTRDDLSDPHAAVVAQCDMSAIYEVGLLKMDFLGLKTLTVMHDAEQYARWRVPEFKLDSVPLDDRETLDLLNRGDTMGVFQLESGGMVDTCRRYGIQKIEDIIDLLALYRPGAMQFMDEMIEVKKGLRQVEYEHPLLEQVSGETYGVMIYQEQVQAAAKLLAGYTLGGGDLLRRAMGKKDPAKMAKEKAHFVEGCWKTNQIDEKTATAIFDKIEKFAGYGFNKSHSACYGHISYWTAYLKAHFPVEFLCGLMSNEANNDKIGVFIQEANRMGIEILPPDVNKSMLKFTPEKMPSGKLAVRYGLAAIKNVGEGAMQILLEEREKNGEFSSMEDICNRLDSKSVNKKILESLIRAGALDWTLEPRCVLFERVDLALSGASQVHKDKALGQGSLFDMTFEAPRVKDEPAVPEWSKEQRMGDEKDLLGAYFCGHPLDSMRGVIDAEKYTRIGLIDTLEPHELKQKHQIAGMVRSVTPKISKAGRKFAILTLEDFTGSIEVLLWSDVYEKAQEMEGGLEPGVFVSMRANIREDDRTSSKSVAAQSIDPLGGKKRKSKSGDQGPLNIIVSPLRHTRKNLEQIRDILKRYPGRSKVNLTIKDSLGHSQILELDERFRVNRCPELETELSMYN